MIKLIIFDMDGLMIDSEPLHQKSFNKVFNEYGKGLTFEQNSKYYVGLSDLDAARDMVVRFALPIAPEELCQKKQEIYSQMISTDIIPKEGLFDLLEKLQESGYKKVIASGCMLNEIKSI